MPSKPPPVALFTPTSAARLQRPSHCTREPANSAAKRCAAEQGRRARRDRTIDSATDNPAPTPAPPAAPQHPPMTASTGTTANDATLPGTRRQDQTPPPAPPTTPARPPPIDALAHLAAATAAARRSLRLTSSPAVARGAGSPKIGTAPASATSQRVSRSNARAKAWPGRVPRRRNASAVPSACSSSAASRCSSSSLALAAPLRHALQQRLVRVSGASDRRMLLDPRAHLSILPLRFVIFFNNIV